MGERGGVGTFGGYWKRVEGSVILATIDVREGPIETSLLGTRVNPSWNGRRVGGEPNVVQQKILKGLLGSIASGSL